MQADGEQQGRSQYAILPFHLHSLDFDITPSKLQHLSSEQLALVQFHPDATKTVKAKAEILFFRRREQDQHLLAESFQEKSAERDAPSPVDALSSADPSTHVQQPTTQTSCSASPAPGTRATGAGEGREDVVNPNAVRGTEMEEGEVSDPGKTSISETSANKQLAKVKQEECDDDIVLVGTSNSRSHRQLSRSVPLAVNVGSTYACRKASYGKGNNSKERSDTHESSNVVPRDSYQEEEVRRESRSPSRLRRLERRHSTKRRREEDTSSREAVILHGSDRKASISRHKDRSSRSRRHSVDRQSSRKRRRQRSYSTSSGSSSCSGSASDESYTSGSSGSSSYSSSVSRSSSPVRHRRHHRSRHVYPAPPPITYSAMPVPVQMPMPVIMPTPPEEDMSRQQMSHLYRNMPSNPSELTVRASTSYAASPPRPAQNNFNFPGYAERAPTLPPNQALQMCGSAAGNVHPARAQAMSAGFGQSPYEPHQAETGYSNGSGYGNNRRGNSGYTSRPPPRPNGTGWPEPAARGPRKTSDWPDDRPNRPRQDRSTGGGQRNSHPNRHLESNASASAWGESPGASDAWGASNGSGNAWGANSPKYQGSDTKTTAALDSNPWGSPPASSTADKGKSGPVWGDSAPAAVAAEEDSPWA